MGYCMEQRDSLFTIKAENKPLALEAIRSMVDKVQENGGGGTLYKRAYSWVITENLLRAKTLEAAMDVWRWNIVSDEDSDVEGIYFEGENLGDDEQLFQAIAPFVEDGSFIEMSGEEGYLWRWTFDNGECVEIQGTVTWE